MYTEENNHPQAFTQQAQNMILSPAVRDAFDLAKESEKIKDAYGRNGFGQSLLLAPAAGGGGQPLCHRCRLQVQRLGHARRQRPKAPG
jgi:hypothetical protein